MDAYNMGRNIGSFLIFPGIPILLFSLYLNWRSKKRLEKTREERERARAERHDRKPTE